ncbi:MAG: preprotein translocase subunit SecY [Bacilli bacterium]|nr:preprotein translocase subunit SecY [Bacilli bacterium]
MFATIKQIFNPRNKELQKRILFTFACLIVFKVGTAIVVPGIDQASLGTRSLGFLELMNVMGGGALERFSIFALGVMPYITAQIIIQLLEMDIVPYFADLAKQGGTGRAKLNQITRIAGIALAFVQGYIYSFTYMSGGSVIDYMSYSLTLTAGTCVLLWLGDLMTQKGIGNGMSIIIMAGIISNLPNMFAQAWQGLIDGTARGTILFVIYVIVYLVIVLGIVFFQLAERRIPIQYSNKQASAMGAQSYLPFKLNSAGVVPVIFASALLAIPSMIAGFIKKDAFTAFVSKWLTTNVPLGFAIYIILIFVFSFFYAFLQLKPKEMADNLQKNGGYIPGVRPGDDTVKYVNNVLYKITFVGSFALTVLAALPIIFGMVAPDLPSSVSIGGTGLLIVVGVALETYKQIEGSLAMTSYRKGRRNR